jgi:hypothetical protein
VFRKSAEESPGFALEGLGALDTGICQLWEPSCQGSCYLKMNTAPCCLEDALPPEELSLRVENNHSVTGKLFWFFQFLPVSLEELKLQRVIIAWQDNSVYFIVVTQSFLWTIITGKDPFEWKVERDKGSLYGNPGFWDRARHREGKLCKSFWGLVVWL